MTQIADAHASLLYTVHLIDSGPNQPTLLLTTLECALLSNRQYAVVALGCQSVRNIVVHRKKKFLRLGL